MRKRSALGIGLAVAAFVAAGCGFLGLNGDPRGNIRPEVFITNYPPASESNLQTLIDTTYNPDGSIHSIDTFPPWQAVVDTIIYLANPRIYWYGTDVDGRVDAVPGDRHDGDRSRARPPSDRRRAAGQPER